jgi:hypothetical protein
MPPSFDPPMGIHNDPLLKKQRVSREISQVFCNPTLAPQQEFLNILLKDFENYSIWEQRVSV